MSLSKYILKGRITTANPLAATSGSHIELLAWLDSDAEQAPMEAMAKVKRQYVMEARAKGWEIDWEAPVLALPPPEVKPNQLLFSYPGIKVYELAPAT